MTQQKLTEKTRDQFIDAATHELRTPLSNIKAYAETLATSKEIAVEEQKEFCNIINSEVTRLARFVDDLLSISSMEAGSIVIERQRTISSRLFEEVIAKVQPLMNRRSIEFDVQLPSKMADLQLDKDKIVAVLVNMLGNAAKYTPKKGRVSLRVKLDESQLQIAVEDTGVGISAEELPKVFDKFFRSSDPRVREETGTGLGLSLAREVIRMHGGDITVESQLDQGRRSWPPFRFGKGRRKCLNLKRKARSSLLLRRWPSTTRMQSSWLTPSPRSLLPDSRWWCSRWEMSRSSIARDWNRCWPYNSIFVNLPGHSSWRG